MSGALLTQCFDNVKFIELIAFDHQNKFFYSILTNWTWSGNFFWRSLHFSQFFGDKFVWMNICISVLVLFLRRMRKISFLNVFHPTKTWCWCVVKLPRNVAGCPVVSFMLPKLSKNAEGCLVPFTFESRRLTLAERAIVPSTKRASGREQKMYPPIFLQLLS